MDRHIVWDEVVKQGVMFSISRETWDDRCVSYVVKRNECGCPQAVASSLKRAEVLLAQYETEGGNEVRNG